MPAQLRTGTLSKVGKFYLQEFIYGHGNRLILLPCRIGGGNINRSLETVNTLLSTPKQNQLFRPRFAERANVDEIASGIINRKLVWRLMMVFD